MFGVQVLFLETFFWLLGEAGVPFYHASGSEFDEVFVGVGARRIREIFGESSSRKYFAVKMASTNVHLPSFQSHQRRAVRCCIIKTHERFSCIPDEKIQVNPRFWSGSEILF